MYFCYIDEAGCTGNLPSNTTKIQPVFVLCGLIVPDCSTHDLTNDFLSIKRQFCPAVSKRLKHDLDMIKHEIKGSDIRKPIRLNETHNKKRRSIGFLDKILNLLEQHKCQILPYIYIKSPAKNIEGVSLYAKSMQYINRHFQIFLQQQDGQGLIIADSRNHYLNVKNSHSIFTQKFQASGDAYPNVIEMPVYGHSDNHAAIQITDILCSAILFPIAAYVYCTGHINSIHVNSEYKDLKNRYANRLKQLSFRHYDDVKKRYYGGITVYDELQQRNANCFFK